MLHGGDLVRGKASYPLLSDGGDLVRGRASNPLTFDGGAALCGAPGRLEVCVAVGMLMGITGIMNE